MNGENKDFEEMFRRAFESAETEPSFVPWAKISEELKKKKKKKSIWLFVQYTAAACIAGLLLIGGSIVLFKESTDDLQLTANGKNTVNTQNNKALKDIDTSETQKNITYQEESQRKRIIVKDSLIGVEKENIVQNNALYQNATKTNQISSVKEQPVDMFALNSQKVKTNVKEPKNSSHVTNTKSNVTLEEEGGANDKILFTDNNVDKYSLLLPVTAKYGFAIIPVQIKKTEIPLNRYMALEEPIVEEEKKQNNISRWQADMAFGSGYFKPNIQTSALPTSNFSASNSALSVQNGNSTSIADIYNNANSDFQDNSFPSLSYQTGFSVGYLIGKRWLIRGGFQYRHETSVTKTLQYSQDMYGEKFPTLASIVSNQVNPVTFFESKNIAYANHSAVYNSYIRLENEYRYLSIPLSIQYRFLDKKIGLSAGSGISYDIFLLNRISGDNYNVKEYNFKNSDNTIYKPLAISTLFNIRADYKVFGKMFVFVEPYLRVALSSYTNSSTVRSMPVNWGLGSGLQYRF
jgi:hypothetical protein